LLAALPERATGRRLPSIPGTVPGAFNRPTGCLFSPRCRYSTQRCVEKAPPRQSEALGSALCHYPLVDGVALGHPDRFGEVPVLA
jgi:dipeptide transport system ATP-binding protein